MNWTRKHYRRKYQYRCETFEEKFIGQGTPDPVLLGVPVTMVNVFAVPSK